MARVSRSRLRALGRAARRECPPLCPRAIRLEGSWVSDCAGYAVRSERTSHALLAGERSVRSGCGPTVHVHVRDQGSSPAVWPPRLGPCVLGDHWGGKCIT